MRVSPFLKRLLDPRFYRFEVRAYRDLPPGIDLYKDLRRLPSWNVQGVILDIGAHIGTISQAFSKSFPDATIHAFEPASETFVRLQARARSLRNVHVHNLAMGSQKGTALLHHHWRPSMHTLRPGINEGESDEWGSEEVDVTTIDTFLDEYDIARVDYVKIDTEGYELEVLEGARKALAAGSIKMIETEVGFNEALSRFVPFTSMYEYLRDRTFSLFGIYEQARKDKRLLRCNAVFIRDDLCER